MFEEGKGKIVMNRRMFRRQNNCTVKCTDRFADPVAVLQTHPQVVPGGRIVGDFGENAPVGYDGMFQQPGLLQSIRVVQGKVLIISPRDERCGLSHLPTHPYRLEHRPLPRVF